MQESKKKGKLVIVTKKSPPPKKIKAYYKISLECHKVVSNLAYRKDTTAMEFDLRHTFSSINKNCWI